jgi:hypothetical protein
MSELKITKQKSKSKDTLESQSETPQLETPQPEKPDDTKSKPNDTETKPDDTKTKPDDTKTNPDDTETNPDDTETKSDTGSCKPCQDLDYDKKPYCKPYLVPISLEILPSLHVVVDKPQVCLINKAVCKPSFFVKPE